MPSWAVPAAADVVTDWDAIAVQAVLNAGVLRPSGTFALDWAMVHVAVHDALQSYQKRFEPYLQLVPGASGSPSPPSPRQRTMSSCTNFPRRQSLDTVYQNDLTNHGLVNNPGVFVGQQAAAAIISARAVTEVSRRVRSLRSLAARRRASGGRRCRRLRPWRRRGSAM